MDNVYIQKCYSYNLEELTEVFNQICKDMPDVKEKSVLLKVNILSDAKPEDCITTNPEFVKAFIRYVKDKGAKEVLVGDSPGLPGSAFCGKNCGIFDVCQQEGATWVNFSEEPVNTKIKGLKTTVPIAKAVLNTDLVFSLAKFKTHQLMYTTGAVKNMFGSIVGLNKGACHLSYPTRESFAKLICSLFETVKPAFCIMDGIVGMEGPGPANGKPRSTNLVLASRNGFALDYAQAVIMGYDTEDIPILNEGKVRKLYKLPVAYPLLKAEENMIKGFVRIPIKKKTHFLSKLVIPFMTRKSQKKKQKREAAPKFNEERCIKCLRCVQICPAKALSFTKDAKFPTIDTNMCIRCYCCHEMCPKDAIIVNKEN